MAYGLRLRAKAPTRQGLGMLNDLRFALRQLLRSPGFTAVAVLTLALGIGATTTLVSVVDSLLFKGPADVRQPDRIVRPYFVNRGWTGSTISYPDFLDLQRGVKAFGQVAAVFGQRTSLGHGANARYVQVNGVTGDFFSLLGAAPAQGRPLLPDDDRLGAPRNVAVASYGFWQRELGGGADAVGRTIEVCDRRYQVVGVMSRGFTGARLEGPDLWAYLQRGRPPAETLRLFVRMEAPWGPLKVCAVSELVHRAISRC